ncbi:hypothetical protein [Pseudorhodoplanes sp.]|jgi:chemotaxis protein histidine kinase CheA|uniref:hypothetical protein n=1 Tax=Pseudorhodoplanes sp. TaxID=1934341 RepID=UPI002B5ABD27|nr:hypothetical protein [Pseudorhodoplanes sp.]HWV43236.1 hypothetical protein [Pseudorhodoplanes sp.]
MTAKTPPNVRIFSVKTRFQELAQRPGGVPRELAIQQAESQIADIKPEFIGWVDHELQQLTQALRKATDRNVDNAALDEIQFRARQLRDTGTTMGFVLITFIADNLCRVIDTVKNGAPYDGEVVDCHVDALNLARQDAYRSLGPDDVPEMTRGLHRMLERANRSIPGRAG